MRQSGERVKRKSKEDEKTKEALVEVEVEVCVCVCVRERNTKAIKKPHIFFPKLGGDDGS